jgi:hypothetical protein
MASCRTVSSGSKPWRKRFRQIARQITDAMCIDFNSYRVSVKAVGLTPQNRDAADSRHGLDTIIDNRCERRLIVWYTSHRTAELTVANQYCAPNRVSPFPLETKQMY